MVLRQQHRKRQFEKMLATALHRIERGSRFHHSAVFLHPPSKEEARALRRVMAIPELDNREEEGGRRVYKATRWGGSMEAHSGGGMGHGPAKTYPDGRDKHDSRNRSGQGTNYTRRMDVLREFNVRHSDMGTHQKFQAGHMFDIDRSKETAVVPMSPIRAITRRDRSGGAGGGGTQAYRPLTSSKRSPSKFVAAFSNSANPNSKPHSLFEDDMDAGLIEPPPSLNAIPGWKRSLHR